MEKNHNEAHLRNSNILLNFRITEYEDLWADLEAVGNDSSRIGLPTAYSYAQGVSYLLHSMVGTYLLFYQSLSVFQGWLFKTTEI